MMWRSRVRFPTLDDIQIPSSNVTSKSTTKVPKYCTFNWYYIIVFELCAVSFFKNDNILFIDSMSTLQKVERKMLYDNWIALIREGEIEQLKWIFCPGHAGVIGIEPADTLAGQATNDGTMTLDLPTIIGQDSWWV